MGTNCNMENSISVLGKISISWSNKGKDLKLWHHHHSRLRQVTYLSQCSFEWDQITSGDLFQPKLFGDSESLCNSSLGKYQKVVFVIEETNSKTERISERMRFIKKLFVPERICYCSLSDIFFLCWHGAH